MAFAREAVVKSDLGDLLAEDAYLAYCGFRSDHQWAPETPRRFASEFNSQVRRRYGVSHTLTAWC